jgi:hypothetical protein
MRESAEAEAHAASQRQSRIPLMNWNFVTTRRDPGLITSPFYLYNSRQPMKFKEQEN